MLEIERKFSMSGFPTGLELLREAEIEQSYISLEPEVRIRKGVDLQTGKVNFTLTIKGDGELARAEMETDVEEKFYYDTIHFLGKPPVKKLYKKYRLGEWCLEVSCVDAGTEHEFFYGEIEFPTEEDAGVFEPPAFLGREITAYKMNQYWKDTRM